MSATHEPDHVLILPPDARQPEGCCSWVRRWMVCLPALGLIATVALLYFVSSSLLAKTRIESEEFKGLIVRSPVKKDGDEKSKPEKKAGEGKTKDTVIGVQPAVELGTVEDITSKFSARSKNLDVRSRTLSFLTTWTVANLIQGALALFVLVLSFRIIAMNWRTATSNRRLLFPLVASIVCAVVVLWADQTGRAPLSVGQSVNGLLQEQGRQALEMESEIKCMTMIGNVSIVLVIVITPLAVCVLLNASPQPKRFQEFQQLMYWTAFLLVAGVVQVTYQNRLPALFFDDEFNVQHIGQMASGTGLLIGGVFSVALGFVFLPAGFVLDDSPTETTQPKETKKSWFTEIVAVLAPLLTALPISKLFDIAS